MACAGVWVDGVCARPGVVVAHSTAKKVSAVATNLLAILVNIVRDNGVVKREDMKNPFIYTVLRFAKIHATTMLTPYRPSMGPAMSA